MSEKNPNHASTGRPNPVAASVGNPWRAGVIAAVMMLVTALVSGSILYQLSLDALRTEVRDNLIRTAKAAGTVIDVGVHSQFRSPSQESDPAYAKAIQPLEHIRLAAGDIRFIYTCVMVSNRVHFVLDPTPAGDADHDGTDDKSHIMQVYDAPSPELVRVLQTGKASADQQPYTDSWGTFISGYAPFFDAHGKPAGAVGVDLDAASYVRRIGSMRRAAWAGTAVALLLSGLAGAGFHRLQLRIEQFRRRIEQLNTELEQKVVERTTQLDASNKKLEKEVTERRRSEKAALQARSAAEAANRAKSEFLATMTHELRTPMNGVVGMANVLQSTPLDEDQAECVQTILVSGESILGIVDNILDFSMLDGEELGLEAVPYSPQEIVQSVADSFAARIREKGLSIEIRTDSNLPGQLVSDVRRVRQVLTHLVSNAIKFTETGGIVLGVRVTDQRCGLLPSDPGNPAGSLEYVCFTVTDTGIGVPPEKRAAIFEEFSQADSSASRKHGGIGLGLALCLRLVQLMDGEIGLSSETGKGSTFWFTLPVGACAVSRPPGSPHTGSSPAQKRAA